MLLRKRKEHTHASGGFWSSVVTRSVVSDSLRPRGLQPARLLCPWDSPGKDTGAGCHALVMDPMNEGRCLEGDPGRRSQVSRIFLLSLPQRERPSLHHRHGVRVPQSDSCTGQRADTQAHVSTAHTYGTKPPSKSGRSPGLSVSSICPTSGSCGQVGPSPEHGTFLPRPRLVHSLKMGPRPGNRRVPAIPKEQMTVQALMENSHPAPCSCRRSSSIWHLLY